MTRIGLYHPRSLSGDGGITRSVRALSSSLDEAGYQSRVIFNGTGHPEDKDSWIGVPHRGFGPLSVPLGMEEAITDLDIVVLHSAWVSYNVVAGRRAARLGIPYVLAPRGAYEPTILRRRRIAKTVWWQVLERRLVEGAAAIHVFFPSQEGQVRALGYEGPVIVAPNGVAVPGDLEWDGGSSGALVYVGRFDVEHKGLGALLEAISLLPAGDRPRLILCGPDWRGGKHQAKAAVERLSLAPWVEIRPPIYGRAKFELMASAKGFLYPSQFEAFGNSAAEAASLGVPVLTGTYPLGRYLAKHDAAIASEIEPGPLARSLLRLQEPESAQLGANAREAMKPFTWRAVAEAWGSQLTELLAVRT